MKISLLKEQKNRSKMQPQSSSFLTSATIDKLNLNKLKERQSKLMGLALSMGLGKFIHFIADD